MYPHLLSSYFTVKLFLLTWLAVYAFSFYYLYLYIFHKLPILPSWFTILGFFVWLAGWLACLWMFLHFIIYVLTFKFPFVLPLFLFLTHFFCFCFCVAKWEEILVQSPTKGKSSNFKANMSVGCRHSSMDSSALSILPPRVWVPCTPSMLSSIYWIE